MYPTDNWKLTNEETFFSSKLHKMNENQFRKFYPNKNSNGNSKAIAGIEIGKYELLI